MPKNYDPALKQNYERARDAITAMLADPTTETVQATAACLRELGYHDVETYRPEDQAEMLQIRKELDITPPSV